MGTRAPPSTPATPATPTNSIESLISTPSPKPHKKAQILDDSVAPSNYYGQVAHWVSWIWNAIITNCFNLATITPLVLDDLPTASPVNKSCANLHIYATSSFTKSTISTMESEMASTTTTVVTRANAKSFRKNTKRTTKRATAKAAAKATTKTTGTTHTDHDTLRGAPSPSAVETHPLTAKTRADDVNMEVEWSPHKLIHADTDQTAHLPLMALSLTFMYHEMISQGNWDTRFYRGRRPGRYTHGIAGYSQHYASSESVWRRMRPPPQKVGNERTLATKHLLDPSTDGWNVVAGAVELARAWGLCGHEPLTGSGRGDYEFPLSVRMRLACCLSIAWKFNRCGQSCYPRRFYDDDAPSLAAPHTAELAHIAYIFFTIEEQRQFGGWDVDNSVAISALYNEMLEMEVNVMANVGVFPLLCENMQNDAEARLELLFDRGVRTDEETMVLRAIVPFFLRASIGAIYETLANAPPGVAGGALVCAAWLVASAPTQDAALFFHSHSACKVLFTQLEREWTFNILKATSNPDKITSQLMALGCFGDPTWPSYSLLSVNTIIGASILSAEIL